MSDLISRSAVMDAVLERMTIGKRVDGVPVLRETITAKELDTLLTDAPAVDVVPVVHAHWIKTFNGDGFVSTLRCSECGNSENSTYIPGNFCWFCGARMDAEEKPDAD